MAYALTRDDLASIKDIEVAFSTERFLPRWEDIPQPFKEGNIYTELAEAIFTGKALPDGDMEFLPGFDDQDAPAALNRFVRAHIRSFSPKHQHKIAGVGFLISQVCKITAVQGT